VTEGNVAPQRGKENAINYSWRDVVPLLAGIEILIQFCFAFHVLKTGRPYWWIFIIMSFPVMGCAIYYFVEVFPGSREHRSAYKTARKLSKVLRPDADLKRRAEELEVCGSVDNKMSLAEECTNHQMYAEAERLYESCLTGAFQSDGAILFGLARAAVDNQNWSKALDAIASIKASSPKMRPQEVRLLEARILEGQGQNDAALSAYRELVLEYVGLEARYRYASFLSRNGQLESATEVYGDVIKHSKRFASSLDDERYWVDASRQAMARIRAGKLSAKPDEMEQ
jgi:hypothetical protein